MRLSGLVIPQNGNLVVKNPIYHAIFNSDWVRQQLNYLEPNTSVLPIWTVFAASFVVTSLVILMPVLFCFDSVEILGQNQLRLG